MAEPINLDELLDKSKTTEEVVDTTESTESTEETEVIQETETVETQESLTEENTEIVSEDNKENAEAEDEEVYVKSGEVSTDENAETEDTETESKEPAPTEYKFKDEFIKKAVDYYEKYGTLQPFLEATQTDYDTVADAELLRMKFDKENSDLPAKTRDKLFQKELEKYNLDSFEDEDVELGQALLKRDANKLRQQFKEQQQQFLQSVQPSEQEQIDSESITQKQLEILEQNKAIAKQGIDGVLKNNFIKVAANGEGVNFQIADTERVVDYALDSTKFLSTFAKQDGTIDWEKWVKVVAFTENPDLFVGELIKHGKSIGRKALEMELKNFKPEIKGNTIIEDSVGSDNPLDDTLGFLKGMKITKK